MKLFIKFISINPTLAINIKLFMLEFNEFTNLSNYLYANYFEIIIYLNLLIFIICCNLLFLSSFLTKYYPVVINFIHIII